MKWFRDIGAGITTVLIFVMLIWWLVVVSRYVGTSPVVDAKGNIIQDTFGNAKDILLAILPLATTAIGYWFGSQGTTQAQDTADHATKTAATATTAAATAQKQLSAVLDQSAPGTLLRAKQNHPDAFPDAQDPVGAPEPVVPTDGPAADDPTA
jgi:hypothetical protein